jgi:hypothetical protein
MSSRTIRVLALIASGALIFIMVGLPFSFEEAFVTLGVLEGIEVLFLLAFLIVFLFLVTTIIKLVLQARGRAHFTTFEVSMLILGSFCLVGMAGQKVMLDEVAHELDAGLAWLGEFIILYLILALQLLYAVVLAFRREKESENRIGPAR